MDDATQSVDDSPSADLLDTAGCARLLNVPQLRLWWWTKTGQFARPSTTAQSGSRWTATDVYRWAATARLGLAGRVPLRYWPDPSAPAEFVQAFRTPHAVALRWSTEPGSVLMVWTLTGGYQPPRTELVTELPPADVVLQVKSTFVVDGPWVDSYAPDLPAKTHGMAWAEISRVLGQPVPYWPGTLRIPEVLTSWKPGAETVEAPAQPDLDTYVLLRAASMYDPQHATARVLVNLARIAQQRATESAVQDLDILDSLIAPGTTVVAARPMPVPDADRSEIDDRTRRVAWSEILHRRDTLAQQCIDQVKQWDGGTDLPFGNVQQVKVDRPHAIEWAKRLESSQRTTAHRLLGNQDHDETFVDPLTDTPVVRLKNWRSNEPDTLLTASVQRLPTLSPLAELVLDDPIWVRTADGNLYPAPQPAGYGPSWGYTGSGPGTLALLIDALLNDISAAAPNAISGGPAGLEQLCQRRLPHGTILTREQLEAARRGLLPDLPEEHPD
jgi:hypothetical protein